MKFTICFRNLKPEREMGLLGATSSGHTTCSEVNSFFARRSLCNSKRRHQSSRVFFLGHELKLVSGQPTGAKVTGASGGGTAAGQRLGFSILELEEGGGGRLGLLCTVGRPAKLALY